MRHDHCRIQEIKGTQLWLQNLNLIVDDDNNIAELVALYLTKECFETKIVNDGEET